MPIPIRAPPNRRNVKSGKGAISKAESYEEIGKFWDSHSLARHWEKTRPAEFDVNILSEETCYALDRDLLTKVHKAAKRLSMPPKALLEKWIREKLEEEKV